MIKAQVSTENITRLLNKLRDKGAFLQQVGEDLKASTQERIRSTKISPDGTPFAPWAMSTLRARQKDGTANLGILFRTGKLHDSIGFQVQRDHVEVGVESTVAYARYLQLGTLRMPARPFVGLSAQDLARIKRRLESHIRNA